MFAEHLNGPGEGPPSLDRWTIDPAAGKVLEERIDDRPQEFPRADERLAGRPHRYGYSVGLTNTDDGDFDFVENSVLKHDVVAGTTTVRPMGAGRAAGELVFVPAGDDAAEDDGYLVGYVHDGATGRSELVVLDAADLTAPAVAVVQLPQRVPFGFHGNWVPDRALS
jgi:carotenoid cleavage dioxygenase